MKKKEINLDEIIGMHTHIAVRRYMYVARLARLARHRSMQKILDSFFPSKWEKDAERLAEMTRKLGYKDWEFYPPKLLKRMGIKTKPGRRWEKKD